jgi:hypothetical protein
MNTMAGMQTSVHTAMQDDEIDVTMDDAPYDDAFADFDPEAPQGSTQA